MLFFSPRANDCQFILCTRSYDNLSLHQSIQCYHKYVLSDKYNHYNTDSQFRYTVTIIVITNIFLCQILITSRVKRGLLLWSHGADTHPNTHLGVGVDIPPQSIINNVTTGSEIVNICFISNSSHFSSKGDHWMKKYVLHIFILPPYPIYPIYPKLDFAY